MLKFKQWLVLRVLQSLCWFFRLMPDWLMKRLAGSQYLQLKIEHLVKTALKKKNNYIESNFIKIFPSGDFDVFRCDFSKSILETLFDELRIKRSLSKNIQFEGLENLPTDGQAPIFFSAHTIGPSWIFVATQSIGIKLNILFRPPDHPVFNKVLHYTWARFADTAISIEEVSRFIKVIKNNQPAIIFPDLRVKGGRNSAELNFCGQPAWTSTFIADIAMQENKPLIPIFGEKLANGQVLIKILSPVNQTDLSKEAITQTMNDLISAEIIKQPSRWQLWNTNRWGL